MPRPAVPAQPLPSDAPADAPWFVGGRICLDLVNTLRCRGGTVTDTLASAAQLGAWMKAAEQHFGVDLQWSGTAAADPDAAVEEAAELRLVLNDIVRGVVRQGRPAVPDIRRLNALLYTVPEFLQVADDAGTLRLSRHTVPASEAWRAAIALDMADLLCHGDLSLLRQCEAPDCIQVFYDTTKNHRRRWCSVERCGSRAKAAAYYQRKKGRTP